MSPYGPELMMGIFFFQYLLIQKNKNDEQFFGEKEISDIFNCQIITSGKCTTFLEKIHILEQ